MNHREHQSPKLPGDRRFLEHFPEQRRSLIANLVLAAVRGGASTAPRVLEGVRAEIQRRLDARWTSDEQAAFLITLRDWFDRDEPGAISYGRHVLAWEAMSRENRERVKEQRGEQYRKEWMDQQPPTDPQLRYLAKLGHRGPAPTSKRQASELIDQLRRPRGGA